MRPAHRAPAAGPARADRPGRNGLAPEARRAHEVSSNGNGVRSRRQEAAGTSGPSRRLHDSIAREIGAGTILPPPGRSVILASLVLVSKREVAMPPRRNVSSPEPQPESSSSASSGSSAGPSGGRLPCAVSARSPRWPAPSPASFDLEAVLTQLSVAMKSLRPDAHCSIRLVDPAAGGYRLATEAGGFQGARR